MDNLRRNSMPAHLQDQQISQPSESQHSQRPSDIQEAANPSQQHDSDPTSHSIDLPSNARSDLSLPAGSASSPSVNDLPPRYDSHQFPPTPPALHTTDLGPGSYFDQSHNAASNQSEAPGAPWSPSEQPPPRIFGSRFPRWGSWLEKRALERHYAQLDSQASSQDAQPSNAPEAPNRKKSWGAWVNGPDAVNDTVESNSGSNDQTFVDDATSLPPLHVHHFGSRFIPHLPAQPLCSILVELPASVHYQDRSSLAPRQALLVGTAQGLYAIQIRRPQNAFDLRQPQHAPSTPSTPPKQWNDNIRCTQILSGIAIYQMCVLASRTNSAAPSSRMPNSESTAISGVFLALTCPSTARDGFLTSSLMQLSAHAGSVLENVAASANFASSSSSSSHNGHGISDSNEGVAAANFGPTAGGGPGRAVPLGGSGIVRMWHLQSIRELLIYALDRHDAQLPIDLTATSDSSEDKRGGLGAMFKKTFGKQKSRSQPRKPAHERSSSNTSLSATIDPIPRPDATPMRSLASQPASDGSRIRSQPSPSSPPLHDLRSSGSPRTSPPASKRQVDPAHAAARSLASSSVPIQPPTHTSTASQSSSASFASLFGDDLIQTFSGSRNASVKGKEREAGSQAASKGVLFFSVHEAGPDTKASGTWYLAITYARTVMVYEAAVPKYGTARAWSFVKELYAPFPIKAVTFAPAAVDDEVRPFTSLPTAPLNAGPTKLRVASANGPLSTSKKVPSHREHGSVNGSIRTSGASSPTKAPRSSAAPASWHKADLCLLLSFGRRAVLVRLRDSDVRELELKPLAHLISVPEVTDTGSTTQLSLQPQYRKVLTDLQIRVDRSRPASMLSENGLATEVQNAGASGHTRTGSVEQKVRDAILDRRSNKHNWVGFSAIEAQILVRQWYHPRGEPLKANEQEQRQKIGALGPSPMGMSMARGPSRHSALSPQVSDKDLPRVPAPQNASFDRRMSRLHLSEQSSLYHDEVQADSSSDSEDGFSMVDARERAGKYQLRDPGPLPQARISNERMNGGDGRTLDTRGPNRSSSLPPAELLSAKLALASRGSLTHVLQLPLAADLTQMPPLAVMQWSDTPNAVSGWARVLGVERATSAGTTPLSHLKQSSAASSSATPSSSFGGVRAAQLEHGLPASNADRSKRRLMLHIGVTCVAFLASRAEVRKVSFRVPIDVNFDLSPDSELELIPLSNEIYQRTNGGSCGATRTSIQYADRYRGDRDDVSTNDGDDRRDEPSQSYPFSYPASTAATAITPDRIATPSRSDASAITQEFEYLCGPLLTLQPVDLTLSSCGAQSLVLPLSQGNGQAGKGSGSAVHHSLFHELGGDAGVVAFDWRGADDFRIFTVGIAG